MVVFNFCTKLINMKYCLIVSHCVTVGYTLFGYCAVGLYVYTIEICKKWPSLVGRLWTSARVESINYQIL